MCPSLSPLYTHFIIIIYCVQLTPWKRQNELCNHFVEGNPSGSKFTKDLASHVVPSLLGTKVFTTGFLDPINGKLIRHQKANRKVTSSSMISCWLLENVEFASFLFGFVNVDGTLYYLVFLHGGGELFSKMTSYYF